VEGTAAPGQFPSSQGSVISEGVGALMVEPGPGVTDSLTWGKFDCFASSAWNCSGSVYVPSVRANCCSRAHVQLCTERRQVLV